MRYTYKVMKVSTPTANDSQLTEDFGEHGFLLVTIYEYSGAWYYVFAKPDMGQ